MKLRGRLVVEAAAVAKRVRRLVIVLLRSAPILSCKADPPARRVAVPSDDVVVVDAVVTWAQLQYSKWRGTFRDIVNLATTLLNPAYWRPIAQCRLFPPLQIKGVEGNAYRPTRARRLPWGQSRRRCLWQRCRSPSGIRGVA